MEQTKPLFLKGILNAFIIELLLVMIIVIAL